MTQSNVQTALELFVETLPLDTLDINTESAKWHDLYSKECELFRIMNTFTEEDMTLYAQLVCEHLNKVGA